MSLNEKNVLEAIPLLYNKNGKGKYVAEFGDFDDARNFAVGMRDQFHSLGIDHKMTYKCVEQRNTNVYMDIEKAEELLEQIKFRIEEEEYAGISS